MNIDHLGYVELNDLKAQIEQRLFAMAKEEKRNAIQKVMEIARQYGLKDTDLLEAAEKLDKASKPRTKVEPRYAHPHDASLTWTGRGRAPKWVVDWKSSGHTIEECLIQH
ncbi:hypothetical protein BUE93_22035 [Chromobacterium amazonense]|uniref:DNA-binding protein H-NS-like C-terminal domain-containing protein n=1 Tax=Chromobacterium amazonense TaxID=1382803 RepID=A0A2S9WYF2_9NEIS|nr:H-NS histone family protein [Chromobacterium amazonense]PRP68484.1 hypothetical protein BUE93_22035 [Chromobacterium amazonense]